MSVRATVEALEGNSSRVVAVPREGMRIGRASEGGLVLASRSVSAVHAELVWQGDDLFVRDLDSRYGTRRDGLPLHDSTRLFDGDELVLGGTAILRISIFGSGFGAPLSLLDETDGALVSTEAPADVRPFSIDMLPVVESLFQAVDGDDLGRRIARAANQHFHPSRVALLELEGAQDRYRVLGVAGAARADAAFVSRTMVAEAARRGVAHYAEGQPASGRSAPTASIVRAGAGSAIAAGIRPHDGRVRVLYLDSILDAPRLTWGHALSLQLFAAHAGAAFEALGARLALRDQQRRFEQLRRYFSPAVADLLAQGNIDVVDRPQNLHATVLFADLVGYTKLSERLRDDPERLLTLLNRWLDAGAQAVLGNGGTLDKFIGDAVMGVFGAPFPALNGELLAVRCALEMREAVARLSVELGESLSITVGINSGQLLAASVGSRRRLEYTVLGDTVNVAARLQGAAHPGEILVGPGTVQRVAALVHLEEAGELSLKNHAPVQAFRVLRLLA